MNTSLRVLFIIFIGNFVTPSKDEWFDIIRTKILFEEKCHQITVFLNNQDNISNNETFCLLKSIISSLPTVSVHLAETKYKENLSLKLPIFQNPRKVTMYVIIQYQRESYLRDLRNTLQLFVKLSIIPIRPKCLIIFFSDSSNYEVNSTNDELKNLLKYAWTLKFLDIKILKKEDEDFLILDYNPLTTRFTSTSNMNFSQPFFTDKLKDMNGYFINVSYYNKPPFINIYNTSNHKLVGNGSHFGFIQTLSSSLNYSINVIDNYGLNTLSNVFERLNNDHIHITPTAIMIGTELYGKNVGIGRALLDSNVHLSVPILYISRVGNVTNIFLYLSFSAIVIFVVWLATKLLKFTANYWDTIYILQILLIGATHKIPTQHIEKLIFISVALASIKYSADTIGFISDNQVIVESEINYDPLQELENPSMPIYVNREFLGFINATDSVDYLFKNTIKINSVSRCFKTVVKTRDRMCLASSIYAQYFIDENRDDEGNPTIKVTSRPILYDFVAFGYERGSPFMEKFDAGFLRLVESGIWRTWYHERKFGKPNNQINLAANSYLMKHITILVSGYFISLIVFVLELSEIII